VRAKSTLALAVFELDCRMGVTIMPDDSTSTGEPANAAATDPLYKSDERFRLLVESVTDYAILLLDPEGRVASWNAGAARISGYAGREIVGRHYSVFFTSEDLAAGVCVRALKDAAQEGRSEQEGWRVRKDGTRYWAHGVITPVHDAQGRLVGFAKLVHDLTARRVAEEERMRLAQAREAIRMRDEFLSIASHELRTPLTSLLLQAQALERWGTLDARTARRMRGITRSARRLAELVSTLLDVTRIASGQLSLEPGRVDLVELTKHVLDTLREEAAGVGCSVCLQARESAVVGDWDAARIEQVVSSLLSNALKYGAGKPVTVELAAETDQAVLTVIDEGPGIAKQDVERVFGRFERAASMRHHGGLGLGLYVCRQIVEAHGGTICASCPDEGGARFTVRLPSHQASHPAVASDAFHSTP
jgi:PAS domain S-box-containing protein